MLKQTFYMLLEAREAVDSSPSGKGCLPSSKFQLHYTYLRGLANLLLGLAWDITDGAHGYMARSKNCRQV